VLNLAIVDKSGDEHPLPQSVWIAKTDYASKLGIIAKKILLMIQTGKLAGKDAADRVRALKESLEFRTTGFKFFDDGELSAEKFFTEEVNDSKESVSSEESTSSEKPDDNKESDGNKEPNG
jgi:hypothetical protein